MHEAMIVLISLTVVIALAITVWMIVAGVRWTNELFPDLDSNLDWEAGNPQDVRTSRPYKYDSKGA